MRSMIQLDGGGSSFGSVVIQLAEVSRPVGYQRCVMAFAEAVTVVND